jgi:hypothetical protein
MKTPTKKSITIMDVFRMVGEGALTPDEGADLLMGMNKKTLWEQFVLWVKSGFK